MIPVKRIDRIHIGDGLLSPLGLVLKKFFGIRTTVSIAGLDITYKLPVYQMVIPRCVALMDKVICISSATMQECIKRGVSYKKCVVVPCGVYPRDFATDTDRHSLETITGIDLAGKKTLITVGRLVKRKGVLWFIQNVLPKLDKNTVYLVIGDGPQRFLIEQAISRLGLQSRVLLLGKVSDEHLKIIYNTADMFVMPNIVVPGDMEGFGIVALEAQSTGLPVVASKLEGIVDAVIDGVSGRLVQTGNENEFIDSITGFNRKRSDISEAIRLKYSWSNIAKQYLQYIQ